MAVSFNWEGQAIEKDNKQYSERKKFSWEEEQEEMR